MEKEDKKSYIEFISSLSLEEESYLYSIGGLIWVVI